MSSDSGNHKQARPATGERRPGRKKAPRRKAQPVQVSGRCPKCGYKYESDQHKKYCR